MGDKAGEKSELLDDIEELVEFLSWFRSLTVSKLSGPDRFSDRTGNESMNSARKLGDKYV